MYTCIRTCVCMCVYMCVHVCVHQYVCVFVVAAVGVQWADELKWFSWFNWLTSTHCPLGYSQHVH